MTDSLITMTDLAKSYGREPVISVASFSLREGDIVEIVGANGSGKSTFLKLLCGIAPPTRGKVWRRSRTRVGYVPQAGGLFEEMTVRQNADLLSAMIGCDATLSEDKELIERFALSPLLDRTAGTLSEGMKRLVAFLCIWAAGPGVLVADEPLAGLDADNGQLLEQMLTGAVVGKRAFVFSTHAPIVGARMVRIANGVVET